MLYDDCHRNSSANRHWLHADERGSIIAQTDATGAVTQINRYDEYGKPQATNVGRFQYTGQTWLSEVGAYYYKARFYSPTMGGRFYQTDPIGYDGGINLYAYLGNDPINLIDPLGQAACAVVTGSRIPVCGDAAIQAFADVGVTASLVTSVTLRVPKEWVDNLENTGQEAITAVLKGISDREKNNKYVYIVPSGVLAEGYFSYYVIASGNKITDIDPSRPRVTFPDGTVVTIYNSTKGGFRTIQIDSPSARPIKFKFRHLGFISPDLWDFISRM